MEALDKHGLPTTPAKAYFSPERTFSMDLNRVVQETVYRVSNYRVFRQQPSRAGVLVSTGAGGSTSNNNSNNSSSSSCSSTGSSTSYTTRACMLPWKHVPDAAAETRVRNRNRVAQEGFGCSICGTIDSIRDHITDTFTDVDGSNHSHNQIGNDVLSSFGKKMLSERQQCMARYTTACEKKGLSIVNDDGKKRGRA